MKQSKTCLSYIIRALRKRSTLSYDQLHAVIGIGTVTVTLAVVPCIQHTVAYFLWNFYYFSHDLTGGECAGGHGNTYNFPIKCRQRDEDYFFYQTILAT